MSDLEPIGPQRLQLPSWVAPALILLPFAAIALLG
jgi:hypothetical protein